MFEGVPVSALAILASALIAWRVQTRISVRRATIDFIASHEVGNEDWSDTKQLFLAVTSGDDSAERMIALLKPGKTAKQQAEYLAIASFLNHFEAVAIAIKHGAMSEQIYKDWHQSSYIRAWQKSQSYINERRQQAGRQTLYENFERLAKKWDSDDDTGRARWFWKRD